MCNKNAKMIQICPQYLKFNHPLIPSIKKEYIKNIQYYGALFFLTNASCWPYKATLTLPVTEHGLLGEWGWSVCVCVGCVSSRYCQQHDNAHVWLMLEIQWPNEVIEFPLFINAHKVIEHSSQSSEAVSGLILKLNGRELEIYVVLTPTSMYKSDVLEYVCQCILIAPAYAFESMTSKSG